MAGERDDSTRDGADKGCSCKALAGAIRKSLDANAGNPGVVPSDLSHLVAHIKDGGEALQFLRGLAAGQDAGGGNGGAGGNAPGPDLSVTYRGSGGGLSPALQAVDAGRCQLMGNGLGRMGGGKR
jgi:hypothetical protein